MNDRLLSRLKEAMDDSQRTWIITDALIQTLPSIIADAVLAGAIPHWFNVDSLSAIMQQSASETEKIYMVLRGLSLTEHFGDLGLTLHDLTRTSILIHITTNNPAQFKEYSRRAYEFFMRFNDPQNEVEALYHLLVIDKEDGWKRFKKQMSLYRRFYNFSAANNLVRNARELVNLKILSVEDKTRASKSAFEH